MNDNIVRLIARLDSQKASEDLKKLEQQIGQEEINMKIRVDSSELSAAARESKTIFDKFNSFLKKAGIASLMLDKVRKSVAEIKNLDAALTGIGSSSELTSSQLEHLGDAAFKAAGKYGQSAGAYLDSVLAMSRSGFDGSRSAALAELSLLAQTAGSLSADMADQYILATNAAYRYNGETAKLNAALDGQNSITDRNHIRMSDMAAAMTKAGQTASECRVSIEELSAMIGTATAVTGLDGSEVGIGISSILSNLQDASSGGTASALKAANVSMTEMADGVMQLRDPVSILRDLAAAYQALDASDPLRGEILSGIGGSHEAQLSALLNNMELFDKMLTDYGEGSGSAMKKAELSAGSLEGSLNRLDNTFTSVVSNIADSGLLTGAVNILNTLLKLVEDLTSALGPLGSIAAAGGGIISVKGAGKTFMLSS